MPTVTGTPQAFAFTTSGTTVTYTGGGTTGSTTFDVLCVNSDNVVTTPAGWTVAATRVNSQGSYIFTRNGGTTSATLALGGGIASNSSALWVRVTGATALDAGAAGTAGVDGASGTATPAFTSGGLSAATEMAIAFAALHGIGTSVPTTFTWSSGYTQQVNGAQGGVVGSAVAGSVAVKVPAGTAAESPSVSWTPGTASDRYMLAVAFTDAAGGTAFTRTVDDVAGLTDAADDSTAFARTADDGAGLTDSAVAASAFVRTQTDTGGLVDAVAPEVGRVTTDAVGLTDTVTTAVTIAPTVTDTAGLTDTAQAATAFTRTVSDNLGPTDTRAVAQSVTVSDSTGLTDSTSVQLAATGARQVDDNLGLTDAVTYSSTQTLTDSLGLTDAATLAMAAARAATDALGLTDSVTVALTRSVVVTDPMGLSDTAQAQLQFGNAHTRTVTDSMGLTSWHRPSQTTARPDLGITIRPASGTTVRPYAGVTSRYPLVPD